MSQIYVAKSARHQPVYHSAPYNRPPSYKSWNTKTISLAVKAVNEGHSQRRAAEEYGIPRSTLGDHVRGRVLPGAKSGNPKYLSDAEEAELYRFLLRCASVGYPRTRKDVVAIVQRVCNSKGLDIQVTHGWWESYYKRHPDLRLRTVSSVTISRAKASDPEVISTYFDMLEKCLLENNLMNKPAQIFNIDETGMPLDAKHCTGICLKGTKNAYSVTSSDRSQITVVACVNAAGWCLPPMVIWDRKTLHPDMLAGEVHGTLNAFSANGWIDQELFDLWFDNLFLKYAPSVRPLLLLMDGHSSHFCPETIRQAAKHRVVLFTLPPNTTHLSQPLDKGCFAPLKMKWKEECHKFMIESHGKVVSRFSFAGLFQKAWISSMTVQNIQAGFEVTGIYPLNRSKLLPDQYFDESLVEDDLPYMPMLTPSRPSMNQMSESTPLHENTVLEPHLNYTYQCKSRPLEDVLNYPSPLHELPTFKPKPSSRVITSEEFIEQMETKQREKALNAYLKEQRKYLRELKKQEASRSEFLKLKIQFITEYRVYITILTEPSNTSKKQLPKLNLSVDVTRHSGTVNLILLFLRLSIHVSFDNCSLLSLSLLQLFI